MKPNTPAHITDFEKHIKSSLEDVGAGSPAPTNWHRMEQLLDQQLPTSELPSAEKKIDDFVRKTVENTQPPMPVGSWAAMSQILDKNILENNPSSDIDEFIKKSVENTSAAYPAGAWELMSKRLDDEAAKAADRIDETIRKKVGSADSSSYQPSAWQQLSRRLDEAQNLRHLIYRYKAVELALMMLFLFTATRFLPTDWNEIGKLLDNKSTSSPAVSGEHRAQKEENKSYKHEKAVQKSSVAPAQKPMKYGVPQSANQAERAEIKAKPSDDAPRADATEKTNLLEENKKEADFVTNSPEQPNTVAIQDLKQIPTAEAITVPTVEGGKESIARTSSLDDMSQLPTILNDKIERPAQNTTYATQELAVVSKDKNTSFWRIGMVSSVDLNYVQTPEDAGSGKKAYAQGAIGFSGGMVVSKNVGKWEFETGFLYSSKKYAPQRKLEIRGNTTDGYVQESLKDIELNQIKIPVRARCQIENKGRWTVFAVFGGSIDLVMQARYDRVRRVLGNPLASFRVTAPLTKDPGGLLESGMWSKNHYFTADIGMGIEYKASNRWSLFVQPTYQQQFISPSSGIGPNKDRINTFSLLAGIKATL